MSDASSLPPEVSASLTTRFLLFYSAISLIVAVIVITGFHSFRSSLVLDELER